MAKRKNNAGTVKKKQITEKNLKANRNYKDTVFRMIFSDRKNLLSLYNAVNGTSYKNPEELEIVTLENAIYMGMKNDLALIVARGICKNVGRDEVHSLVDQIYDEFGGQA